MYRVKPIDRPICSTIVNTSAINKLGQFEQVSNSIEL